MAGVAIRRLVLGGWDAMLADHSRYVFSGLSLLSGRGYVGEAGEAFYIRAPMYPTIVGGAFALAGSDGAHLAAWALGLSSFFLAIWLAARLGGSLAAVATAAAVIAVPQFWEQIVSIGIDLPHAAFYLGAVALLWKPRPGLWLAAGCLLGIAMLIKETVAPAVLLLPIAWLPPWSGLAWPRWTRLTLLFLLAVVVVAGWWWLLVWRETGYVFPLNSIRAIVPDEADVAAAPSPLSALAWLAAAAAWAYLLYTRFRDPGVRLLALAAVALGPAVAATIALSQPERNLTALVLLSCVAAGAAVADLWRAKSDRLSLWARRAGVALVAGALIAGPIIGQRMVARANRDSMPADAAAVIRQLLEPGQDVISSFRGRSPLGVELFDLHVRVRLAPVVVVGSPADPSQFLWLGDRRGTLFGLTRANWQRVLGSERAAVLVLIGPHKLTPTELLPALRSKDPPNGLTFVQTLVRLSGTADIFRISPDRIDRAMDVHLHAQPDALLHWLDMADAAGVSDGSGSLLAARPVVPVGAAELKRLATRLGAVACFRPMLEDSQPVLSIEPAAGQGDCLPGPVPEASP